MASCTSSPIGWPANHKEASEPSRTSSPLDSLAAHRLHGLLSPFSDLRGVQMLCTLKGRCRNHTPLWTSEMGKGICEASLIPCGNTHHLPPRIPELGLLDETNTEHCVCVLSFRQTGLFCFVFIISMLQILHQNLVGCPVTLFIK